MWLEEGENGPLRCARKGQQSFLAYTAPELLGLTGLGEHLGNNWTQQAPNIYGELIVKIEA